MKNLQQNWIALKLFLNYQKITPLGWMFFFIEFYKTFRQDLKEIFLKCLNYSLVANQLCHSQYEGLITLILKSGKNTMYLPNCRSTTLLNCDYKFISQGINNRTCGLLPKFINYDQTRAYKKSKYCC